MTGPRRDSAALGVASVITGLAAYAFVILGNRAYGSDAFSAVAQVWTIWFIGAAVLTFPVQHWVIHRATVDGDFGRVRQVLPRLAVAGATASVAVGVGTAVARQTLFASESLAYPLTAGVVTAGACVLGVLRGSLAGRGRFRAAGTAIAGENLVRLALGAAVVAADGSVELFAAALGCGVLVAAAWPGAWRFGPSARGEAAPLVEVLSGLGGGTLLAQAVLTGGPLVLAGLDAEPAEVTALFLALSVFRAPYLIALGVSVRGTATLSATPRPELAAMARRLLVGAVVVGGLFAAGGALVGPWGLRLLFGDDIDISRGVAAAVGLGCGVALANLGLSLVLLVLERSRVVLGAWLLAAAGAAAMLLLDAGPTARVVAAFVTAELVASVVMAVQSVTTRPGTP